MSVLSADPAYPHIFKQGVGVLHGPSFLKMVEDAQIGLRWVLHIGKKKEGKKQTGTPARSFS